MLGPTMAYPGNWTAAAPLSTSVQTAWTGFATLIFFALLVGGASVVYGLWGLVRAWRVWPETSLRGAFARALIGAKARRAIGIAALGYIGFAASFLSLFGYAQSGPGIWAASYPSGVNVLCCGPVGFTPVIGLLVTPALELVAYPLILLLIFGATLMFALNVASIVALLRTRTRGRQTAGAAALGALGAVLVNCPACGAILLTNVLAGTAAAGLLVAWAGYQIPLALTAFPLSFLALIWNARHLATPARDITCRMPAARS